LLSNFSFYFHAEGVLFMGNLSIAESLPALAAGPQVHANLPVAQLIETALARGEARLASNGALVAYTGSRTGRSPKD
jgi:phosphoenolpyruvate carboxykinase (ATP)